MPDWSDGEGGGAIHDELAQILGTGANPGDVLFFGCVGNTARRHWRGSFQADRDGFHQWTTGQKDNGLQPWGSEQVSIELYCQPGATYELLVQDKGSGRRVGQATSRYEGGRSTAAARFHPEAGHAYAVRLRLVQGQGGSFHLV